MKNIERYESPKIEITRFEMSNNIMTELGGDGETGQDYEGPTIADLSESETSDDLDFFEF